MQKYKLYIGFTGEPLIEIGTDYFRSLDKAMEAAREEAIIEYLDRVDECWVRGMMDIAMEYAQNHYPEKFEGDGDIDLDEILTTEEWAEIDNQFEDEIYGSIKFDAVEANDDED